MFGIPIRISNLMYFEQLCFINNSFFSKAFLKSFTSGFHLHSMLLILLLCSCVQLQGLSNFSQMLSVISRKHTLLQELIQFPKSLGQQCCSSYSASKELQQYLLHYFSEFEYVDIFIKCYYYLNP